MASRFTTRWRRFMGARFVGEVPTAMHMPELLDRHLHLPFAYPSLHRDAHESAAGVLERYFADNEDMFDKLEYSEKKIEIALDDGVTVVGRIDLVRRLDNDETTIVDFKTSERSQEEEVTELQLHIMRRRTSGPHRTESTTSSRSTNWTTGYASRARWMTSSSRTSSERWVGPPSLYVRGLWHRRLEQPYAPLAIIASCVGRDLTRRRCRSTS